MVKESPETTIASEPELAAICVALGAHEVPGWSAAEQTFVAGLPEPPKARVAGIRDAIRAGDDALGTQFCLLRSSEQRRSRGATYTPRQIVQSMVDWTKTAVDPQRIVDPGAGSGRFLLAAAAAFPRSTLIGIELDPLAALMARANLAVNGLADRAEIHVCDYRQATLGEIAGRTLFIGNPPYVRHHDIDTEWKAWLSRTARAHGLAASQLSGLHVHFFLATLNHAKSGDIGTFVTAAEWLDVNYGKLVRDLLAGPLGLLRVDIVEPMARTFDDALTTAAIASFEVGDCQPFVSFRRVASARELKSLSGGIAVPRTRMREAARWTQLSRARRRATHDLVELGELCSVHRGQVTGCNDVWIVGDDTPRLPPRLSWPAVTRAKELFNAGSAIDSVDGLRRVIDIPPSLDSLSAEERVLVEQFLQWAKGRGAHESYIACHREPWWSVKLRRPAPILATYMARRPPAFVRNSADVRHINIAHGIYPRNPLPDHSLDALAAHLHGNVSLAEGRTYAGGLTKFEPKEMERLLVPTLDVLRQTTVRLHAA